MLWMLWMLWMLGMLLLVLRVLLVQLWVVWSNEVLAGHDRYLLSVHPHPKLHVILIQGLFAVLLHFRSAILEPVL